MTFYYSLFFYFKCSTDPSIIYPKNGGALLTNKRRITTRECLIDLNTGFCSPYISNIEYFYFWFLTLDLKQYYTGTAVPTVASGIIKQMIMPLPPLAEQKRIVKKLDEILGKVDELGKIAE
ncbi:restriction endonuclease subunit S [Wohlfahrtiimonas chitiniclastica]|uniref:restriction endonuclease subunit S n=1 Tax=Wohlfahrtiimonas chitiniclastica TaxID=400946 RepID=UPI0009EE1024